MVALNGLLVSVLVLNMVSGVSLATDSCLCFVIMLVEQIERMSGPFVHKITRMEYRRGSNELYK